MHDNLPANTRKLIPDDPDQVSEQRRAPTFQCGNDFGRYVVRRFIGSGGMAEVYEAEHLGLRKRVALKVLTPTMAQHQLVRRRFIKEGERAARIRHEHVVDITDVGEVEGLPYIVMEYLEGESLGDLLLRQAPLPVEQATNILLPVLAATDAGHAQGVVHRDLKPDNIFLHRDGTRTRPKVLDFGVSRVRGDNELRERLTVPNAVLGTPQYMAPEQARGEECDERSDQYTLALVLYEAVTGALPREGDTLLKLLNAAASGIITPPSVHLPGLPPEFEAVILRALAPEPEGRYLSIGDFARALLPYASPRARDYWALEFAETSQDTAPSYDPSALASDPGLRERPEGRPSAELFIPPPVPVPAEGEHDAVTKHLPAEAQVAASSMDGGAATIHIEPRRRFPLSALVAIVAAGLTAFAVTRLRSTPTAQVAGDVVTQPTTAPSGATAARSAASELSAEPVAFHVKVSPGDAKVYLDGALLAVGGYRGRLPRDGRRYELRVEAPGHEPRSETVTAAGDIDVVVELEVGESTVPSPPIKRPPSPGTPPAPAAPDPGSDFVRRGQETGKPLDKSNPYK